MSFLQFASTDPVKIKIGKAEIDINQSNKETIPEMEAKLEAAWREAWHWEGMIFREKLKSKALTEEETRRISRLIGSALKERDKGK
jgi:hypothetical protein